MGFLRFSIVWAVMSTLLLAFAAWLSFNGYLSENTIKLWSKTILVLDGPPGFKSSEALYPPLPFFGLMILHSLVGVDSVPIPTLFAALIMGLLGAGCYRLLRTRGEFSRIMSSVIVFLIIANPMVLFTISDSPEFSMLLLGCWMFAEGSIHLRRRGNAPDLMLVGLSLMLIGLSSSYGLLLCMAALPIMAIVAPPKMLIVSPTGTVLSLIFPVICAVGSLLLISSIFDTPLVSKTYSLGIDYPTNLAFLCLAITTIPLLVTTVMIWRAGGLFLSYVCIFAMISGAMFLDANLIFLGEPIKSTAPFIVIASITYCEWPKSRFRGLMVFVTILLTWIGGAYLITQSTQQTIIDFETTTTGDILQADDSHEIAAFIKDLDGVLLDAESHPELIASLKTLDNLIVPGAPEFEMVMFGGRPEQPYIVLEHELEGTIIEDTIKRRFPDIKDAPPRGYMLIFEHHNWAIYKRDNKSF